MLADVPPQGWTVKTLGELAAPEDYAIVDGPFGSNLKVSDYVEEGTPVLQGGDITGNRFVLRNPRFVPFAKAQELRRSFARVGDLLVVKIGSIGYSAIIEDLGPHEAALIPANLLKATFDRQQVETRFIYQYFASQFGKRLLLDSASQTAQPALTLSKFKALRVTLPPLPEQRRIAAILDSADEAIGQTEALISKLKQAKDGLMHDLLTRGIDEHGHLRDSEANPEQFKDSPLGWVPREWEAIELRDCLTAPPQNGLYKPAHQIGSGTHMLGQTSITEERSINFNLARRAAVANTELEHFGLEEGDILVARVFATVEGVGRPALIPEMPEPAVYESNMMRLQVDRGVIIPGLLFSWLRLPRTRKYIASVCNASNQTSINQASLNVLPVALPPTEEQRRIADILDAQDERIRAEEAYRDKLVLQKRGLMDDLLTGRVRVNGGGEGDGA